MRLRRECEIRGKRHLIMMMVMMMLVMMLMMREEGGRGHRVRSITWSLRREDSTHHARGR
eukprot:6508725-Pyramimonas_sp.AAC.1